MPRVRVVDYAKDSRIVATVRQGARTVRVRGVVLQIARGAGWVRCRLDDGTTRKVAPDAVEADR